MKIKTLIPFLIILLLLVGLVAWQKSTEKKPAPIAEQVGLAALVPDTLSKSTLDRIELFSGADPEDKVVLQKKGDQWQIASLFNAPAEESAMDDFVNKLLSLKGEPRATADSDDKLASFALRDDEAFHVQAWLASGESPALEVLVGKAADFRTVFLRKAGEDKVFVESNNLRREAGVSEGDVSPSPESNKWLKSTILEADADQVEAMTLKYPDKELAFKRQEIVEETESAEDEDGAETVIAPPEAEKRYEWTLASETGLRDFKDTEIATILTRFSTIRATDVADPEDKATCGFDEPQFTATLAMAEGDDIVIHGGKSPDGEKFYLQQVGEDPALVYEVAKYNFEQLFVQASKLFTLPEWALDEEDLAQISLARPEGTVVMEKVADDWKILQPQMDLEQQSTAINAMKTALASLKAIDAAGSDADIGAFDTTLQVTLANGSQRSIQIGQPSKSAEGRYVRFDDSDTVMIISRADAERLLPPVRDLFSLAVLDVNPNTLTELKLSHEIRQLHLLRDPESKAWSGTLDGKPISPTSDVVEDYVMTVNSFQMDSFIMEAPGADANLVSSLSFTTEDGETRILSFSKEKDGFYDAALSWLPYTFKAKSMEIFRLFADVDSFEEPEEEAAPEEESAAEESDSETAAVDEEEAVAVEEVSEEDSESESVAVVEEEADTVSVELPLEEEASEETMTVEIQ